MNEERTKHIVFIFYILSVLILGLIYFSVPERKVFIGNVIKWWSDLWDIMIKK